MRVNISGSLLPGLSSCADTSSAAVRTSRIVSAPRRMRLITDTSRQAGLYGGRIIGACITKGNGKPCRWYLITGTAPAGGKRSVFHSRSSDGEQQLGDHPL